MTERDARLIAQLEGSKPPAPDKNDKKEAIPAGKPRVASKVRFNRANAKSKGDKSSSAKNR